MDDIPRTAWYRLFEILPGAMSWLIIIVPFVATFAYPRAVSIFLIIYITFWFLRTIKNNLFLIHSYRKNKRYEKQDWLHLLSFFSETPPTAHSELERETARQISLLKKHDAFKTWESIVHVVIIATYKEEKDILESTIESIVQVKFPLDRIILVLATEERDRNRAESNAKYLEQKFPGTFGHFYHFMHPANVPGELPAKGANITHAGRRISEILEREGVDFSNVLVTTLDADNRPHATYFANLTYHYLMEERRERCSYQPLPFFYNNIWDVPFTNRLIALANTFWFLAESGEPHHLFTIASYAQSLDTLVAVDFWSRETIVEDYHQFWRSYFHFNGDYEVRPLFVPVYQDALQNRTYFTSLVGQYKQLRRWAWGASDIAYIAMKMWKERRHIPFWRTFLRFIYLWYLEIMWATGAVLILLNRFIPTVLNPQFARSVFAYNLGQIFNITFTAMTALIVISLWICVLAVPKPQGKGARWRFVSILLQWFFLPLVTIIYGAIPALDAQTRLMLNKPLAFGVTEKIRKIS